MGGSLKYVPYRCVQLVSGKCLYIDLEPMNSGAAISASINGPALACHITSMFLARSRLWLCLTPYLQVIGIFARHPRS